MTEQEIMLHSAPARAYFPLGRLLLLDEVGSTNTELKRLGSQGAAAGTVLIARRQSAGRGRRGRSFVSQEGGLYFSILLRPKAAPEQILHLTALAAVAAAEAVEQICGARPGIKWTNDLVFGQRKLAGILTELALKPDGQVDYVVLGIGVNCDQTRFPDEICGMATSLAAQTGKNGMQAPLAAALWNAFARMDAALLDSEQSALWLARFAGNCVTLGKEVQLIRGDSLRQGFAYGIGSAAELLVRFADGSEEAVSSGEVTVRGMYGYV